MSYHCPNCGKEISFGEAICPHCSADTTSVWDQANQKKEGPKVVPGTGVASASNNPFPPAAGASPFPPPAGGSPFPPPAGGSPFPPPAGASPFPPPAGASPFPPPASASPFPPPAGASPFPPPSGSSPFPPVSGAPAPTPVVQTGSYFEIPQIAGKLYLGTDKPQKSYGREEIQGIATKALPDLNAYNNISRVRKDPSGTSYSEHFIIHYENDEYKIEDLHSTNGTYLNNTKLKGLPAQPLKDGDKVILPIEEFGKMVQLEMIFHK